MDERRGRGGRQWIPRPAEWSPGPEPPWATVDVTRPQWCAADLARVIPPVERPLAPAFPDARPSAVLIALADGPSGAEVLLTKRSMRMRNHRGEVSFPGGRMDPGETSLETALREANEEVGLDADLVTPRGELTHLNTVVSRSYIVPHVVELSERPDLTPTSPEVDRVWWTPVAELLDGYSYHAEHWGQPPTDRVIHFFDLDDETVWGATAHLLVDLFGTALPALR